MRTLKYYLWISIAVALAVSIFSLFLFLSMQPSRHLFGMAQAEDNFERKSTHDALGIPIEDVPDPLVAGIAEGKKRRIEETPSIIEQDVSGPAPRKWFESVSTVAAKAPDGRIYRAYCGSASDDTLRLTKEQAELSANRRHLYSKETGFHPDSVFIGPVENDKIAAKLVFPDVGSHNSFPHHFAIDGNSICHLVVADVYGSMQNRLKLYWCAGNLKMMKWERLWLIHNSREFTAWARTWCISWKTAVHVVWVSVPSDGPGRIYHAARDKNVFTGTTDLGVEFGTNLDVAVDPGNGELLIAFSNKNGVFVCQRKPTGEWTRPSPVHRSVSGECPLSLEAVGNGKYVVRLNQSGRHREFLVSFATSASE